jgi:hypothetical protein
MEKELAMLQARYALALLFVYWFMTSSIVAGEPNAPALSPQERARTISLSPKALEALV